MEAEDEFGGRGSGGAAVTALVVHGMHDGGGAVDAAFGGGTAGDGTGRGGASAIA